MNVSLWSGTFPLHGMTDGLRTRCDLVISQTGFMNLPVRSAVRRTVTQLTWKERFSDTTSCRNRHFSFKDGLISLYDALPHNRFGKMCLCFGTTSDTRAAMFTSKFG